MQIAVIRYGDDQKAAVRVNLDQPLTPGQLKVIQELALKRGAALQASLEDLLVVILPREPRIGARKVEDHFVHPVAAILGYSVSFVTSPRLTP
jgi:hypothetical protein